LAKKDNKDLSHKTDMEKEMKLEYNSLLIAAVILLGVGQALEGLTTPVRLFLHGVLVGLSIVCRVLGLVLYVRSPRRE
jgi:hypothetical protein